MATNRRGYLRESMQTLLDTVTGIAELTFQEIENPQSKYPKGAHRLGAEDFTSGADEGRRSEIGVAHFLVAIDLVASPNDPIDDVVDSIIQAVEIAIKRFTYPAPFTSAQNEVYIKGVDRVVVAPGLDRQTKEGRVLFPVTITYLQRWK